MDRTKVQRVEVSPQLMFQIMRGDVRVVTLFPDDAQVVGAYHDPATFQFSLYIHSESFDSVPEGGVIPIGPAVLELVYTE